jgi:hypothetical protein
MSEVFYTDEFRAWFDELEPREQEELDFCVGLLANYGTTLGYPHSSAIKGSRYPFRELRPKRGRSPLRVVYAFDPRRDAVLILGGDKGSDAVFYDRIVARATTIWKEYLAEQASGKHDQEDEP